MKKVLIALDYGISAKQIAEQGFELAISMNAEVTLLHVVADQSYYNIIDSAPFALLYGYNFFNINDATSIIDSSLNYLNKIKSHLKNEAIEVQAIQGDFATVILETATKDDFDVIVIGSKSQNWLQKAVVGSVTESVLEKATIPIFIIPIKEDK